MNTKNLIYIFFSLVLTMSCNDEFMERVPLDQISEPVYWESETDLQLYCNSFYPIYITGHDLGFAQTPVVPYGYVGSKILYGDIHSDNGYPTDPGVVKMVNGQYILPSTSGSGGWDWKNVRALNYFLNNYNSKGVIDPKIGKVYAGEIYFFKAWEYFNLIKLFGEVPWYSKVIPLDSEELYAPRTPRVELLDSVLATINKAVEWLPSKGKEKTDRINKDMALLLKARICLYEGTFRKYQRPELSGTKFLEEAVSASNDLIKGDRYSIYTKGDYNKDYNDWFVPESFTSDPEIILWKKYTSGILGHATLRYHTFNIRNYCGASKSLIEEYLCKDGLSISKSPLYLGDDSIQSEMTNRDPRLRQTINFPGEYMYDPAKTDIPIVKGMGYNKKMPNISGQWPLPGGYRIIKFWKYDVAEMARIVNGIMPCPEWRYAEVLLINAEANAELGKCDQLVLNATINKLRDRVGMPNMQLGTIPLDPKLDAIYSLYAGYVPSPLLREIRRERRVELAWENFRWDDLVRWKCGKFLLMPEATRGMKFNQYQYPDLVVGKSVLVDEKGFISPYKLALPAGRVFKEPKQYFFPIPIEDITLNPKLVQSPGWE